jgi:hypothetical protein
MKIVCAVLRASRWHCRKNADIHPLPGLDSNPRPLLQRSLRLANRYHKHIGFIYQVLTAVLLKIQAFWDVTSCRLVVNDVSAERSASIFRVRRFLFVDFLTLMAEVERFSETSVTMYQSRRRNVTEYCYLHTYIILPCPYCCFPLFYSMMC